MGRTRSMHSSSSSALQTPIFSPLSFFPFRFPSYGCRDVADITVSGNHCVCADTEIKSNGEQERVASARSLRGPVCFSRFPRCKTVRNIIVIVIFLGSFFFQMLLNYDVLLN